MGYTDTVGFIIYLKPDKTFVIHRSHHVWFNEYNSRLYIENNKTPGSLLIQQDLESIIHNSDFLNFITYEIDLTSNPFSNATILKYDIELPPYGKKIGLRQSVSGIIHTLLGVSIFCKVQIQPAIASVPNNWKN